jgi:microtubule-associated protein-like 1/2
MIIYASYGNLMCVISLCRYPCLTTKAEYNEEKVYSMQIAAARFMYNDKNVVTVGGTDATLILWDVIDD